MPTGWVCLQNGAGGFADSSVRLYDMEALSTARGLPPEQQDGAGVQVLYGHFDSVYGVSFSPDSQYLLSSSGDGTIRFWSIALQACVTQYQCALPHACPLDDGRDHASCLHSPASITLPPHFSLSKSFV